MIEVKVQGDRYTVDPVFQWDKNIELKISGLSLPSIPEIHFSNPTMSRALVKNTNMDKSGVITVEVPNSLLQQAYPISAYVCIYEGDTFKSLYLITIPVKARLKPADYTLEGDNEVYSFNELEALVKNTVAVLTANNDDLKDELHKKIDDGIKNGVISQLKNLNGGTPVSFWVGTNEEYEAIEQHVLNCFYIVVNDDVLDELEEQIATINDAISELVEALATHEENITNNFYEINKLRNGKEFLNVKDYGAKGDGATDDYEAISNLLTKYPKANLYFPAGKYLISDTLDITGKKTLRGSGNTTIAYTGEDLLLHISSDYLNKPTIEQLNFTSSANTLLLSCKRANNTWGGSFVMRDCKIVGFNHTIMRFNSAYHVELNNLIIQSNGMFVFTTTDGTTTESNFSNSINFTNVHHSLLDKNTKPSILFDIQNVRQIMFYNCQFHDCTTLMQGTTAKEIHFINTWFERIENIYKFDSASDKPKMTNCRYVEMKKFNGNSVVIDENRGEKHIEIFATENEYTPNLLNDSNEEILFSQVEIFNAKDTYAKYFYPYKFTSKAARIYLPFNCVKKTANDADTLSYELKRIISYAHQYCDFEIIAICDYPDNTKTIVKQKVVTAESDSNPSAYRFYAASAETFFKGSKGDAKNYTANLSTDVNGQVTLSTNVIAATLTLLIKFNILGGI